MAESQQTDVSITIGGDAGQGVESSGAGFTKALARGGLEVFSVSDYRSRIRGGHNFYQIRAASRPVYSHSDPVHLLLALTKESIEVHMDNLAEGGGVIYDQGFSIDKETIEKRGLRAYPMPLAEIAEEHGSRVMLNTAALGAAAGILGFDPKYMEEVIRDNFAVKGERVVENNLKVLRAAYDRAAELGREFPYKVRAKENPGPRRAVLHGNHAFALGALAGGCRFISAYPMTPGTSLFEYMTAHAKETGVVTKHAEDEIAAMCMAIGAGAAGARAMVTTSGGGFSLMVEALGMAGMTETPVVVYIAQRGGPSTGLPTRTEQGDLLFAINASQGEFPRIVLAPGTIHESYEMGWRAFNLAEKYQCPVLVLSDQFLASSLRAIPAGEFKKEDIVIDRGETLTAGELDRMEEPYRRFALTPSGVSPRAIFGHPKAVYSLTTDEHSEESHITEDIDVRNAMMAKRMRKLDAAVKDMAGPTWYGPQEADVTLIGWGSTYGPLRETVGLLGEQGQKANLLHFSYIWPFPVERALEELRKIKGRSVAVEQNYTSQFTRLLRMTTGYEVEQTLNKYDGRPFSPQDIIRGLEQEVLVHG